MSATLPADIVVLERGWLSSNSVVLLDASGAALIDSGYGTHAQQTLALVSETLGSFPLRSLVNTHLHSDHCGGNAAIQSQWPHVRTYIPPGQADAVRRWDTAALTYAPTGQTCPRFGFNDVLVPGKELALGRRGWQVHAAPGHDPHSVVLFEPMTRTLVSADALWENGFGVVFPELEGEEAFGQVAATFDLIEALEPSTVIPGHGRVFEDVSGALDRARVRLASYVRSPPKHATHAAKVLLKFKLLELQRTDQEMFLGWGENTDYLCLVHAHWFAHLEMRSWLAELVDDLIRSGAALRDGSSLTNG